MTIRDNDGNAYSPAAMALWAGLEAMRQDADAAVARLAALESEQERDESTVCGDDD